MLYAIYENIQQHLTKYFKEVKIDGGDANNDGAGSIPLAGDWQNIKFTAGSRGNLDNILFRYDSHRDISVLDIDNQALVQIGGNIAFEP